MRLDLKIPTGCVYGLLGRNGAGKSTAIKMLTGMIRPDAGDALVLGENSRDLRARHAGPHCLRRRGACLYPLLTIAGIERFTKAFYPAWNGELFDQILEHFELARKQRIWRLSRGQRAQVAPRGGVGPGAGTADSG